MTPLSFLKTGRLVPPCNTPSATGPASSPEGVNENPVTLEGPSSGPSSEVRA